VLFRIECACDPETPLELHPWLQAAVRRVWLIAEGSLSLKKTRCIRKNCSALLFRRGTQLALSCADADAPGDFSIYVPDDLAPAVQQAIQNGRHLPELTNEAAGVRFVHALKNQRRDRSK
jgi:hypothetical protein